MGDVELVREAHRERRLNAERLAPHLVRPLEFVVPVGRDAPVPLWKVRAGVWLYGSLARFGDGRSGRIPVAEAASRVPGLRTDGIAGTVLYHDHLTHDGRLTLAAAQAAAARGRSSPRTWRWSACGSPVGASRAPTSSTGCLVRRSR